MNVKQFIEALSQYPDEAMLKCGLSVPDLFINTSAHLSISGDNADPTKCQTVRLITAAPSRLQNANSDDQGAVQAG